MSLDCILMIQEIERTVAGYGFGSMHNLDPLVKALVTWKSGHQCIFHYIISDKGREVEGGPGPDHNEQLLMQTKASSQMQ